MEKRVYKLYQYKDSEASGCMLYLLTGVAYLFLGLIFLAKFGAGGIFLLMALTMLAWYYIRQRYRSFCTITVADEGFTLNVVKPSSDIEVGKRTFSWNDLQDFRGYPIRGGMMLEIYCTNTEEMVFTGYECSRLLRWLEKNFPEKRRK